MGAVTFSGTEFDSYSAEETLENPVKETSTEDPDEATLEITTEDSAN